MSIKVKPSAEPTVLSLINEKIDTLENNITHSIDILKEDLGTRITELSTTVKVQNGRIGRVEQAHATCQAERATERRLSRKQIGLIGGGGLISGAALIQVLRWLGERLHTAGLLG